jgi:Tol biopolymer transport system component
MTRVLHTYQEPTWSPDGRQIAFRSRSGLSDIFVMEADGSNQRLVAHHPKAHTTPPWIRR